MWLYFPTTPFRDAERALVGQVPLSEFEGVVVQTRHTASQDFAQVHKAVDALGGGLENQAVAVGAFTVHWEGFMAESAASLWECRTSRVAIRAVLSVGKQAD